MLVAFIVTALEINLGHSFKFLQCARRPVMETRFQDWLIDEMGAIKKGDPLTV